MELEFDETKSAKNRVERGIGFERFVEMDLARALSTEDVRRDYGERRVTLLGPIEGLLHVAVVTFRADRVRVISLRRANRREERRYAKESESAR